MNRIFITLFIALISISGYSQYTQTIRGKIIDETTGSPIPGVNIVIPGSEPLKGTMSLFDGSFLLENVPTGRVDLHFSMVGFFPVDMNHLVLKSGKELQLTVKMREKVDELEAVEIVARGKEAVLNEMASVSARSFSVEQTERYAGSLGDPSRMAQNFAGVVSAGDQRNDIIIRGNSPTFMLWQLDGIPIPNPNHFGSMGSTGGPVSMLNNNLLATSDFYTGAFPAEYGNALSGVFDLNMRHGNSHKREYVFQVGFNGFEGGAEGPFSKNNNSSYLINYRYSTLDAMSKIGFDVTDGGVPQYQDLSFNLFFPTEKTGTWNVTGLWGTSYIEFIVDDENPDAGSSYNTVSGLNTHSGSTMGLVNVSNLYYFNKNTRLKSYVSAQMFNASTTLDSIKSDDSKFIFYHENNKDYNLIAGTDFLSKINRKNTLKAGVMYCNSSIDYRDSTYLETVHGIAFNDYVKNFDIQESGIGRAEAFAQWKHLFSDKLNLITGLYSQYLFFNNNGMIEPRMGLNYNFKPKHRFSVGAGLHSQAQPNIIYFLQTIDEDLDYLQTNIDLGFTKSAHLVASYQYKPRTNLVIKSEIYGQYLYDVPVESDSTSYSMMNFGASMYNSRTDSLVNEGTGYNYGLEITIEKFFAHNWYLLTTASLFNSKYKTLEGETYNTVFNNNFILNVLGGYEFRISKNIIASADLRTVYAGGRRLMDIDVAKSVDYGYTVYSDEKPFEMQTNPYFRTDLRLRVIVNGKRLSQEWAIDLQNLTNHKNIYDRIWNPLEDRAEYTYQSGFYPMFLYRIHF